MDTLPFFCPSIMLAPSSRPASWFLETKASQTSEFLDRVVMPHDRIVEIRRDAAAPLGAHWHGVAWPSGTGAGAEAATATLLRR